MKAPITNRKDFEWFCHVAHYSVISNENLNDIRNFWNAYMSDIPMCMVGCTTQQALGLLAITREWNATNGEIRARLEAQEAAEVVEADLKDYKGDEAKPEVVDVPKEVLKQTKTNKSGAPKEKP